MARAGRTPTPVYRDGFSIAQLASDWGRDPMFVKGLIEDGKLVQADDGLITISALHEFYHLYGHPNG